MKNYYLILTSLLLSAFTLRVNAQTNIAPLAIASASTCNTGACSTLNDLNYGTCGTQQMWISTGTPPSLTPGVEWMQFDWTQPMSFNAMTIHHAQTGTRFMAGATVQTWDPASSTWITFFTFSNLPDQCINTVPFPSTLTTARFRLTSFTMSGSQLSNINFREIEIWQAPPPVVISNPPNPNFQFTLGLDTLWEKSVSTLINTSTDADKSYWNVTQYSPSAATGPWSNYSTLPRDTLQCNTLGCFLDTVKNVSNLYYYFPVRGYYKVQLTTINVVGKSVIEKIVYVDTPRVKPSALFFATRRQLGCNDRIQLNNLSSNAPASVTWWAVNNCSNCAPDSNKFLPSNTDFNPTFAAFTPGTYKICVAVSNSKGIDTFCRQDYIKVLPGYMMCHSEPNRFDSVGTDNEGYLYSDLKSATGSLSGTFVPSSCGSTGFRIAPCADTIYLTLERLRLRPGTFAAAGDSLYIRLNGFNGTIARRFGGNSLSSLKDTTKVYKYAGQQLFITYVPMVTSPAATSVADSGFTLRWSSSPAQYPSPTASFTCPDTLYSGYTVRFMNGSSGKNLFYSWDLNNDGIFGLEKPSVSIDSITVNPAITYFTNSNTTRKVCLKTANCKGTDLFCKTLPLLPFTAAPVANFIVNRNIGFVTDTFQFTDKTVNGALTWRWRFDPPNVTFLGGTDTTSQYPMVSLNAAQTYNVTLLVTNPIGASIVTKNQIVSGIDYGSPGSAFDPSLDATDFGISRVVIKGQNSTIDTITPLKSPAYTRLFYNLQTSLYRGGVYTIDIYRNTAKDAMTTKVWADFNRDADYTDDGENIFSDLLAYKVKSTVTFRVPDNAVIGTSRILIGACNNISTLSPVTTNVGVYEDYGMKIENDFVKPTIVLNGNQFISTEVNIVFNDPSAKAIDNIEGDISSKIKVISNVDVTKVGLYSVRYYVTDLYGNTSDTLTRFIQVVINNNGPTLSLIGADTVIMNVFDNFVEPGYTALDNLGNPLTPLVQRSDNLNTSILGTYSLIYTIKDAFGLAATKTRVVIVKDLIKPSISLFNGTNKIVHQIGTAFDDNKYILVTDNYWKDVAPVRIAGTLNTNIAGIYTLTYTATDGSNNVSDVLTIQVQVTNKVIPIITLVGSEVITVPVLSTYNDLGVVVKDYKGDLLSYSSDLNEKLRMDTIWDAIVTYTASDEFGNTVSAQRTIKVRDLESPKIELLGANPFIQPLCKVYTDAGIKITDNFNGTLVTNYSKIDGKGLQVTIDSSKVNVCGGGFYYIVTISANDASGNKSEIKKRTVYISLTGINDIANKNGFNMYPNPATNVLHIELKEGELNTASAIDIQGKSIDLHADKSGNEYTFNIAHLTPGIYLLKLETIDGNFFTGKFTVIGN